MEREKLNKKCKLSKEGYIIISNYFLREWVQVLGVEPALLYLQLLSYCHKEKDIAWPTINSLCQKMGVSKNSLIKYREILLTYGLIKKMIRRKSIGVGDYQVNNNKDAAADFNKSKKVSPAKAGEKREERDEREEDEEREKIGHKKAGQKKEALSQEKALEMIRKTREMLANL